MVKSSTVLYFQEYYYQDKEDTKYFNAHDQFSEISFDTDSI